MSILSERADTRASSPLAPTVAAGDLRFRWRELIAEHSWGKNSTVLRVLLKMDRYANSFGRDAHPGNSRLAAELGLSVDSVKRALRTAVQLGFLQVQHESKGRGNATVFMVTIPAGAQTHSEKKGGTAVHPFSDEKGGHSSAPLSGIKGCTTDEKGGHSCAPPSEHYQVSKGGETQVGTSPTAPSPADPPSIEPTITPAAAAGADRADEAADTRPADRCPDHAGQGWVETPCHRCAAAKAKAKAWDEARAARQQDEARTRRDAAAACTRCDEHGFIAVTDTDGHESMTWCDHTDAQPVAVPAAPAQVISLESRRKTPDTYTVSGALERLCVTCGAEPGHVCTGATGARRIPCTARLRPAEIDAAAPAAPTRVQVQA